MHAVSKPDPREYPAAFAGYVDVLRGGELDTLEAQPGILRGWLRNATAEQLGHRYAPGKWSVREVAGHMADAERVFGYRLLCIARGDTTPLPGFEEDAYVASSGYDGWDAEALVEHFASLRRANVLLVRNLDEAALDNTGQASGNTITVRALVWVIGGHAAHHLRILRERYGLG